MEQVKTGRVMGTGAAINVSLGWVPDRVEIINLTDGDKIYIGWPAYILPFTSGGTTEIEAGDTIVGATDGATAKVKEVHLVSGTWAGGDAAGYLVLAAAPVGTFGAENVYVGSGTNDATVAALVNYGVDIDTEVAGTTGNASVSPYAGSSTPGSETAPGFTIGSTISESGDLLVYHASRNVP